MYCYKDSTLYADTQIVKGLRNDSKLLAMNYTSTGIYIATCLSITICVGLLNKCHHGQNVRTRNSFHKVITCWSKRCHRKGHLAELVWEQSFSLWYLLLDLRILITSERLDSNPSLMQHTPEFWPSLLRTQSKCYAHSTAHCAKPLSTLLELIPPKFLNFGWPTKATYSRDNTFITKSTARKQNALFFRNWAILHCWPVVLGMTATFCVGALSRGCDWGSCLVFTMAIGTSLRFPVSVATSAFFPESSIGLLHCATSADCDLHSFVFIAPSFLLW